ncbi:tRNA pseudouridine synthase A [Leucobacter sp. OH2974_COT-288]|nr:tRNA pseudouridine synthase A [Leucobacter sp. OH2974_COT-288]
MIRIRLDIAYDGTDFKGWATQPGLRTVQQEIETALSTVLRRPASEPVQLTVGGRTDAGVHARGQVAHCDITAAEFAALCKDTSTPANRARRVNGVLQRQNASDILIADITEVPAEFDARFGALWRRYEYRVAGPVVDPLARRFTATAKRTPQLELLQQAAAELVGLRDFGAFCKAREGATTIRNLTEFSWRAEHNLDPRSGTAPGTGASTEAGSTATGASTEASAGTAGASSDAEFSASAGTAAGTGAAASPVCVAHIQADAFCHSMVRALIGACVAVATGRITLERLREIRDAAERSSEFTVMPAHGLSLEEIAYPASSELAARVAQTRARREPAEAAPEAAQTAAQNSGGD